MNENELKILSSAGRILYQNKEIPPYPEILHLTELKEPMIAQVKINGYNVRIANFEDGWAAFLRGGFIDEKTNKLLKDFYGKVLDNFFKDNPNLVLCVEVIGKKTMANTKGEKDIDFFVFDIMDLTKDEEDRLLPFEEVSGICEKYNLNIVKDVGVFEDKEKLEDKMLELENIFEGIVLKSLDCKRILKYKWKDNKEKFAGKYAEREKIIREETSAEKIVSHFFQGYSEKELGLDEGFNLEEFTEYQRRVELLARVEKNEIGKYADALADWLMELIKKKGWFEEKILEEIKKEFKKKIGKEISKIRFIDKPTDTTPSNLV